MVQIWPPPATAMRPGPVAETELAPGGAASMKAGAPPFTGTEYSTERASTTR